ncbi:RNA-binding protein 39-like [Melia azedarach]|uniref:RNA-binding protein 39-like n=2 Tax=Melia azedarach TaxID=155640 RepID=A0ACC1XWY4_MELAZ|nr:RNA-binding protein 39-like [Melia azedarach]KAJ4715958.1 RNA-binding protein 39-like [Melia azedarach]
MDFDEYEYLEKTVENPEPPKTKGKENGDGTVKSEDRERGRYSKHKSDEKVDDYDDNGHRSKGPKHRDETQNHDREKERGSSHHRSRSRDGGRDRHRSSWEHRDRNKERDGDREERNGRDIDRDRGWDRDRDRRERGRDSERDREKDKDREREKSRRSGSRSDRHRNDLDEREKSRDGEYREREKERELGDRDRESRRHKEKKEEAAEPEVDPERDQRTVFAYQICLKANERDVYEFFSRAGKVRDVRLIMDRNSRRSKGVGYVEFYDVMSVPMAIALSGQPLLGQPVMVKPSEAEKNLVQSSSSVAGASGGLTGPYSGGARRLYVGNLHFNMTEDQLRQVFEPFGTVELVQLPVDDTGHCKGFGFVQFGRLEDARNALNLNGQLEIAGRAIKVSAVTDQNGGQDVGANTGDFDDDEGGGLSLNARSRALLMQKLDRSGGATTVAGSVGATAVNSTGLALSAAPILGAASAASALVPLVQGAVPTLPGQLGSGLQVPTVSIPAFDTIGVPSECLLLKNMFDPNNETYEEFDVDIKEDVEGECSKFGKLKHIFVEKDSAGFVYLRFENSQSAIAAQRALHGRWFAGKMITASFMVPETYEAKFPDSR